MFLTVTDFAFIFDYSSASFTKPDINNISTKSIMLYVTW